MAQFLYDTGTIIMISIIIPALNEEKYLPILLKQIRKQDLVDYEIIVADADSHDKTKEIAQDFGCKIVKGGLPPYARNQGAKAAKGNIFLFLDADNIYLAPNLLNDLLVKFQKRNLDIACFPIFPDGNRFDYFAYKIYNIWVSLTQNFLPHATNAILVKKEIHTKIKGFDEQIKIAEDHDYARRAAKFGSFGFIKTKPALTSARRFITDGRIKTYSKFLLCGLYIFLIGPVKKDIFKYRYGHYNQE